MNESPINKLEIQNFKETESAKKRKLPSVLIIVFVVLVLGSVGLFFALNKTSKQNLAQEIKKNSQSVTPTPTPGPFDDMTIPYLRAKDYGGEMGDLSQVSTNQNYTTYLASYDSDGLKINGLLTIPTTDRPIEGYPAIVFVHGYIPPTIYQTLSNYSSYVDYLARNGFVVFKIDLRGHAESEGEASGAYYSGDYVIDVLNAHHALENFEEVNPKAIGLWGHSMAGNVTFRSLAAKPTIPAVVIWAGAVYTYSDMQEFGIDDNSYRPPSSDTNRQRRREQLFNTYGQFSPDHPFWMKVAPTNYLSDIKGAVQLNHAVDDTVVNIGYSRGLSELLQSANIEYELKEYQTGGHNLTGQTFNSAMQDTVSFYKKHLK